MRLLKKILVGAVIMAGFMPASGTSARTDHCGKSVASSIGPTGYIWKEGEWFAIPTDYLIYFAPDDPETLALRSQESAAIWASERPEHTGYAKDGRFDATLLRDEMLRSSAFFFGFKVGNLEPCPQNTLYHPDISDDLDDPDDSNIAIIGTLWLDSDASPVPKYYRQVFDNYHEKLGPPAELRRGHLADIYGKRIPYQRQNISYYIYETAEGYQVRLSCHTKVAQPMCDGSVRDTATGIYISVTFPESIIWFERSWLEVVDPAFKFIKDWHIAGKDE